VLFTSSVQLDHLDEVARVLGIEEKVAQVLREDVVIASVGPVVTATLESYGLPADIIPNHPKMGSLVKSGQTLRYRAGRGGAQISKEFRASPMKVHPGAQCARLSSKHCAGCLSPRASGGVLWGYMQLRLLVQVFLQRSLLLVLCISRNSCQSQKANSGPSIEFNPIPPAAQVRRERVDTISGRVRNARPKQQIVIYVHSGVWWVQPQPAYLGS
jgi:hypothetical protein